MYESVLAEFTIRSDVLSADDIAKQIPLQPTRTWNKGDPRIAGATLLRKENGWALETEASTERPSAHIKRLLDLLAPALDQIAGLESVERLLRCIVYCTDAPELFLEHELVMRISALNTAFDIDIFLTE